MLHCCLPVDLAQRSTAQHSTAQHSTAQHSTAQHSTAQHSTAQHSTAQHSTAQHSTALHCTALHCTALLCTALVVAACCLMCGCEPISLAKALTFLLLHVANHPCLLQLPFGSSLAHCFCAAAHGLEDWGPTFCPLAVIPVVMQLLSSCRASLD